MIMKATYDFSIEDWLVAQKYFMDNSKIFKRNKTVIMIAIPAIFALVIFYLLKSSHLNSAENSIILIMSFIYIIAYIKIFPKYYDRDALRVVRKLFEEGENSGILGIHEITLTSDKICCKEPGSEVKTMWGNIVNYVEDDNYIILFITSLSAIIIPKEKMVTSIEKEQIFQFIRKKVNHINP